MEVVIVEDEQYQAEMLTNLLRKFDPAIRIVQVLRSVPEAITYFKQGKEPDLIFMDVELRDDVCFSIFREVSLEAPVIFTTSHRSYSIDAFYHNGIHYLVKPITLARLQEGMQKFYQLTNWKEKSAQPTAEEEPQKIILKVGRKNIPMEVRQIARIQISDSYVYLSDRDGKRFLIDHKLEDLERILPEVDFFRLNRQMIVHKSTIKDYSIYTRGRLKVSLHQLEEPEIVSFKRRHDFLDWVKEAFESQGNP